MKYRIQKRHKVMTKGKMAAAVPLKILGLLLAGFGVVSFAMWANQKFAIQQVREIYPAPGRLYIVQGHKMHLNCTGIKVTDGAPTIIIDAGNASYSLDWSFIQHKLEPKYRVCTYDRPGYGWSEPSKAPRDVNHIVEELHTLLQTAGESAPYLLVGHSLGGLHMQFYTARYPDEVAGLILVESPTTNIQNKDFVKQSQMTIGTYRVMRFLTASGLLRVLGPLMGSQALPAGVARLSSLERDAYLQLILDPQHYTTGLAEMDTFITSLNQLKAIQQGNFSAGAIPLIVITSGMVDVPEGNNPFQTRRIPVDPQMIEEQAALTQLSTQGRQIVIPDAGHLIQHDAPEAILNTIDEVMQLPAIK